MSKCEREVCECTGNRATLRMFCQHFNAERPENEVERESIRMWSSLPEELRRRALKHMQHNIPSDVIFTWYTQRRRGFAIGSRDIRFHFDGGMAVRNLLRQVVPDDELPWVARVNGMGEGPAMIQAPTQWDDYYYGALWELVGAETSDGFAGSHIFDDAKLPLRPSYREKCKRFRTDGPTPCLCCPDECVGDYPGHTYVEACANSNAPPALWKFMVWVCTLGLVKIK